jgi:hypothetical protein
MSRDLMHTAEIKDLVRDAYRHVPPTTAALRTTCTATKSWRWFHSRQSTERSE